jgi:hypothetical protein
MKYFVQNILHQECRSQRSSGDLTTWHEKGCNPLMILGSNTKLMVTPSVSYIKDRLTDDF